jgi:biotin operon repressor
VQRPNKAQLLALLQHRVGRANGVSVAYCAGALACSERVVRELVTELREDGIALCGHPSSGYFIAANKEELEETCAFLRSRAMHSLVLEARLRGMPLADLVGQLHLPT